MKEVHEKIFIGKYRAYYKTDNFTGIVKFNINELDFLSWFLCEDNKAMAHPKEIEAIKHYIKRGNDKIMKIVRTIENSGGYPNEVEILESGTLEDFENRNKEIIYNFRRTGSMTVRPYNLDVIKKWIKIRDNYTYVPKYVGGQWKSIDIREDHAIGSIVNYIFIEPRKKLWRIHETYDEFHHRIPEPFKFEDDNN